MSISFKASIKTGFFRSENFLVCIHDDHEKLILAHEKNDGITIVPFHKIRSIHLSMDRFDLVIRTDGTIIEGIILEKENVFEIIELLKGVFGPLFVYE